MAINLEDGSAYTHQGKLELTEVSVDKSTGSVTLRAIFPNPEHQLLPGMYVHASVDNGVDPVAILAPQQGITRDPKGNATALIVNSENKVERRDVTTEQVIGNRWLIGKGLYEGDRLIVEGTDKVNVGDEVNVTAAQNSSKTGTDKSGEQ